MTYLPMGYTKLAPLGVEIVTVCAPRVRHVLSFAESTSQVHIQLLISIRAIKISQCCQSQPSDKHESLALKSVLHSAAVRLAACDRIPPTILSRTISFVNSPNLHREPMCLRSLMNRSTGSSAYCIRAKNLVLSRILLYGRSHSSLNFLSNTKELSIDAAGTNTCPFPSS